MSDDQVTISRELLRQVIDAACSPYCAQDLGKLIPALRTALEQPAVEPVYWGQPDACGNIVDGITTEDKELGHKGWVDEYKVPLYTAPQAQQPNGWIRAIDEDGINQVAQQPAPVQEPVAWVYQNANTDNEYLVWKKGTGGRNWRPLFTSPSAQETVVEVDYRGMYLKVRDELVDAQQRLDTCEVLARSVMNDQVGESVMRPNYCPMANEPCQRICDVPCSAHRLKPADDSDMAVYKAIAKNYTTPQAQPAPVQEPCADLIEYILQDDIHNRLTPRVVDIAYSAWHIGRSGKNKDDGGPCDWFNDTKPMVMTQLAKIKKDLAEKAAPVRESATQAQQPPRIGSGVTVKQTLEQWEHDFSNPMTPEQQTDWVNREREFALAQGLIKALEAQVANQQKHLLRQDAELAKLRAKPDNPDDYVMQY